MIEMIQRIEKFAVFKSFDGTSVEKVIAYLIFVLFMHFLLLRSFAKLVARPGDSLRRRQNYLKSNRETSAINDREEGIAL